MVYKKVFGIGMGRTGTKSLTLGLQTLGYSVKHFSTTPLDDCYIYDSLTDSSAILHYKEFDFLFPDAKFICTTRDIDSWLDSWQKHYLNQEKFYNGELPE